MRLPPGTRLGPYEVVAPIGAGGMGEVYRARDQRLGREVAVKVLPEAFVASAERLARFQREAQVLASLNHPNIAAIYGLEENAGIEAIVLELVEGETLAERLAAGPIPVGEALEIARQIAEALEAAHERGIVHRDLKPGNVKLTPEGKVKVLDFGLAKALTGDASSTELSTSPTMTAAATAAGVVIGTAAYMSPEQARGKPVDKRADVWAFGAVIYEILTGRRAFDGETVSDALAAILTRDPDWNALPATAPAAVRKLLMRCLERDRNHRLHDMADARIEVEEAIAELHSGVRPAVIPSAIAFRRSRVALFATSALVALALATAAFLAGRRAGRGSAAPVSAPSIHAVVPLPEGTRLAGWASPVIALSPDGRKLAFVATREGALQQLYIHRLDRGETQLVPDSDTAEGPFFSPDSQWVAFATDVSSMRAKAGEMKKFSLATGLTQSLCPTGDYFGGFWGEDDWIWWVGEQPKGIWRVPAGGGTPAIAVPSVRIGGRDTPRELFADQPLPGGRTILVTDATGSPFGDAAVLDTGSRELTPLVASTLSPSVTSRGQLLYVSADATLFAAPFDAAGRRITGARVALLKNIAISNAGAAYAVSRSGLLAYATGYLRGSGRELMRLVRITRNGDLQPLAFDLDTLGRLVRVSPDGRRLAVAGWDPSVWIYDLARNSRSRLPGTGLSDLDFPAWAPDGERVAYVSERAGETGYKIWLQKSDGTAPPELLVGQPLNEKHPRCFTPDGRAVVYEMLGGEQESPEAGIWIQPLDPKGPPRALIRGQVREPMLSPDGRWLVYSSAESGTYEVYARRFPELGSPVQISAGEGRAPLWSRDGREIFYRKRDGFYAVAVHAGSQLEPEQPRLLFERAGVRGYDVAPDGNGFFAVFQPPDSGMVRQIQIVTNWLDELERLAPAAKGGHP